jgi:hypothetical protein
MASSSSHLFARTIANLGFVALIVALSACAQTGVLVGHYDEPCQSVLQQTDGSWRVESPIKFGRTVFVESGATLYKGEVLDGIDLGAVLQRRCGDPSLILPESVARF